MDITAIIVTAQGCGGCIIFKAQYMSNMLSVFGELNIKVQQYEAESIQKGISPSDTPYRFLSAITFYPCIMLIDSDILELSSTMSNEDVFNHVSVFNGQVQYNPLNLMPVVQYEYTKTGYVTFIEDYLTKNRPLITDTEADERFPKATQPLVNITKTKKSTTNVMCGRFVPVNTYRR